MSAARRKGLTSVEKFRGALAQPATLSERQFVHQGAMLLDGQGARSLLFGGSLGCLHIVPMSLMFADVK